MDPAAKLRTQVEVVGREVQVLEEACRVRLRNVATIKIKGEEHDYEWGAEH